MTLAFLKPYVHPAVSIKALIHNELAGVEEPRPHFPLRASMLMKPSHEFCPREHALLDLKAGELKGSFVGTALQVTYDHGKDSERRIRNLYLRKHVVGQWNCRVCKYQTPTMTKAPKMKCPKCGYGHQWDYHEPRFEDKHTGISGGIDVLVDVGRPKLRLVELKTMAPDDFKALAAPLAEHRFRTTLYLHLVDKSDTLFSGQVDTEEANILYVCKAFGTQDKTLKELGVKSDMPFSPYKEFIVKPNPVILQTSLNKSRALKVWRDYPEVGMPAGVCANALTKRAKSCSTCAACWSGKFPSALTWLESGQPRHPDKKLVD